MSEPENENGQAPQGAPAEQAPASVEVPATHESSAGTAPVETSTAGAGDAGQEAEAEASASDEAAIAEQVADLPTDTVSDKAHTRTEKYVAWLESLVNAHRVHEGQIRAMARRAGVATPDFEHPSFDEFCKEPS